MPAPSVRCGHRTYVDRALGPKADTELIVERFEENHRLNVVGRQREVDYAFHVIDCATRLAQDPIIDVEDSYAPAVDELHLIKERPGQSKLANAAVLVHTGGNVGRRDNPRRQSACRRRTSEL